MPELAWTSGFPRGAGPSTALTGPPPYRLLDQSRESSDMLAMWTRRPPDRVLLCIAQLLPGYRARITGTRVGRPVRLPGHPARSGRVVPEGTPGPGAAGAGRRGAPARLPL